jgi:undecaprenyl-diphosphatase
MIPSIELLLLAGPVLLFLMAFGETSGPIGLTIPAGVSLSLAAFLADQGLLEWESILTAAGLGALAGDSTGFWLGRRGSQHMRSDPKTRLGRSVRRAQRLAEHLLKSPPILSVTMARLASFVRTLMPAAAGMSGMSYRRFLAYDVPGVLLWVALYVGVGVVAGQGWRFVSGLLGTGWAIVLLLAFLISAGAARLRSHPPKTGSSEP